MPTLSLDRLQHIRSSLRSVLTWRIVVLAAIVLVVFTGGQRLLGSLFLSAGMVRQQIHEAVLRQTGLQFLVNGETSISFWPSPYITLKNVDVIRSDAANEQPVFHADAISGRFDVVSALTGSPQFGSITLTRPVFRVDRSAAGTYVWQAPVGAKSSGQTTLDDLHLGRITLVDGMLEFHQLNGFSATFRNVAGSLDFSTLSRTLSFDLSASASDRPLTLTGSLQSPEKLLSGDNSTLSVKLVSDDIDASFSGKANIGEQSFLSGTVDASASDLGAVASWVGLDYAVINKLTVVDLKATIVSEGLKFTLSDLKLQLPAYQATGILSAGWTKRGEPPFFSGTLAFDNFDAGAFLTAFVPSAANLRDMPLKFDTSFLREFQVDLRLSATKASFGAMALADMAAGVRITDGHASFAIATGQVANGNVSAEISVDEDREKGPLCKLSALGRNVDLSAIPAMLGLSGPWPQATGSFELDLRSRLPLSPMGHAETSGSIRVHGGAGKLSGFDPAVFRELASQKRFFDLSLASASPLRFDSFELAAVIDNGIAELNTASFSSTSGNLDFAGVIPYKNNSIAVSGTLGPPSGVDAPATRFFAGGAWPNILISPFSAIISGQ
ncbi:AsmA family protein [Rhizobium sp. C1]|uniref:AsmA family protein n=1 Tax=Rhizobium sp. C1 TaxID=1349799 RepID=UPI001E6290DB|nr:AsmA-like C-terminal region-containing protein [Rhizobium sp. C1]MCD2179116.1 hypothetical protein [Rhizobium sp. C1]